MAGGLKTRILGRKEAELWNGSGRECAGWAQHNPRGRHPEACGAPGTVQGRERKALFLPLCLGGQIPYSSLPSPPFTKPLREKLKGDVSGTG